MAKHLHRDLEQLTKDLLGLGGRVEEAIDKAITSLVERRLDLAEEVILGDAVIDQRELEVEEDCLKILALHQPVAADLRFIVAVIKVNNDLERMGDLAANMAARALYLGSHPSVAATARLGEMAAKVRRMVGDSLDSLVNRDPKRAKEVCRLDDEVDKMNRDMFSLIQEMIQADPDTVKRGIQVLSVSRQLERLADHATNIAEDVVFMVEGETIRHPGLGEI
jgi:phosphate transport system protein